MAQNIYDDVAFFEGYSRIRRSIHGLEGAPEWPNLRAMLPEMAGLSVLDLGCGFGAFDRWAHEQGAASVLGVDLSERMLAEARRRSGDMPIRYERADLEQYEPAFGAFELVYSTLVLHYLPDLDLFCRRVRAALVDGGHFVFTSEHPLYSARTEPEWMMDAAGNRVAAVTDYNREGPRTLDWLDHGVVKYHRTIATVLMTLKRNGLMLEAIDEWGPTSAQLLENPGLQDSVIRPMFLMIAARAEAARSQPSHKAG
ncbi:MAG TPA: class I SAM-dependent methyltransferase [Devosiaceae bacterium]|jgi:SAM-dependent methyltransferase